MANFFKKSTFIIVSLLLPLTSFANGAANTSGAKGKTATQLLKTVGEYINIIIPIIIGLALLVFLFGVVKYFFSSGSQSRVESIQYMTWGVISLFVMVSIWGFVALLQKSFLSDADPSAPPTENIESLKKVPQSEASAPVAAGDGPIFDVINKIAEIISDILPLLLLLGVLFVLFGILKYAFSNDSSGKESAKNIILWGVIGLTVMAFVWSIVVILQQSVFEKQDPNAIAGSGKAVEALQKKPETEGSGNFTGPREGKGINVTILKAASIVQDAIPLLISLGIVLFLFGVLKYVGSSSAKIKSEGLALMSWGIIVLLVMGSVWYFVNLIAQSADISLENQPNIGKGTVTPSELIIR